MTPKTFTALAVITGLMSTGALAAPRKNTASARERAETRSLNQQALAAANGNGSMGNGSMSNAPGARTGQMQGNMMPGSSSGTMPGMNPGMNTPTMGNTDMPRQQNMPSQSSTPQTDMPESATMPPKG